jgi:hypothetical protein
MMPTKHGSRVRSPDRLFVPEIGLSEAGSVRVQFRPAPPLRSLHGHERELAASIYDLAAALERRCDELGVGWAVSPEPFRGRLDVELAERDDPEPAAELVAATLSDLGLA